MTRVASLILVGLVVAGCSGIEPGAPTDETSPPPAETVAPTLPADRIIGPIHGATIGELTRAADGTVTLAIPWGASSPCTGTTQPVVIRDGADISIAIDAIAPAEGMVCAAVIVDVTLDVALGTLEPGTYRISLNGGDAVERTLP